MTPEDYLEALRRINEAFASSRRQHWNPPAYGLSAYGLSYGTNDLMPVYPRRSARIDGSTPTFEERLTEEDHKLLVDLKVGL